MIEVQRIFAVTAPPAAVQRYLADFGNATEWDPGTKSCIPTGSGPVTVGSTWRNVSEFNGRETELTYRMTRFDPTHLQFVGENKTVTSTDDISFAAVDTGTTVTYRARFEFHGVAKLATPFLKRSFDKLADQTADQLTRVLNAR